MHELFKFQYIFSWKIEAKLNLINLKTKTSGKTGK